MHAQRLGAYEGLLKWCVLQLKTLPGELLAYRLGQLWAESRRQSLLEWSPQVIVPVPLHWWKRRERGYDQTSEIARGVALGLKLPLNRNLLKRIRYTPSQAEQTAEGRWLNVRGTFACRSSLAVRGLRILLIDDVLTTGATCHAAAQALLNAGAAQVTVAVLAHR